MKGEIKVISAYETDYKTFGSGLWRQLFIDINASSKIRFSLQI